MTRTILTLVLVLGHVSLDAAPRRRAVGLPAVEPAPEALVTAARQAAATAMEAGVPAVQIAISHRGRVIYVEAFGVINRENGTAATPRSVLRIGSLTKQFTSAAILRLAERGALSLDDRIEKFVPEFDPRGRTITLRHLLTHTSGVARDWFGSNGVNLFAPVTRAGFINTLNTVPFDFAPGTSWNYSNAGYMLLGFAIESITGLSYRDFVHSEFVLPLGLIDTGVCGTASLPLRDGYGHVNGSWIRLSSIHTSVMVSSGSFCSTASDLVRWSHLLATGGVMLPSSYTVMTTPARLNNNTVVPGGYALGVVAWKLGGHPVVSHGGAVNGFLSYLLHLSDQDISVAVLTNGFPTPDAGHSELMAVAIAKVALDAM